MGMGGGSAPSTQTVTQKTEVPQYIQDYAKGLQASADEISARPFPAYDQPRIAGFAPYQTAGQDATGQNAQSPWYGDLAGDAGTVGQDLLRSAYSGPAAPYQPYNGYQPFNGQATADSWMSLAGPANVRGFTDRLNPNAVAPWMSPYIQQALQPQLDEIGRNSAIAGKGINAAATAAGAFGDASHGVQLAENDRNTAKLMSDVTGQGYQSGYDRAVSAAQNAYGQNADTIFKNQNLALQQYGINAGEFNAEDAARRAAVGQNAQFAGQNNTQALDAYRANSGQALSAWQADAGQYDQDTAHRLAAAGQLPATIAGIYGISEQQAKDLMDVGQTQQAHEQSGLSTAYQDFLNQFEYPQEMLNLRLATLAQTPYNTTRLTTTPYSSTAQNIGLLSAIAGLGGSAFGKGGLFGSGGSGGYG